MKKLAIFAVLGFAVCTQAATIQWSIGGDLYGVKNGTATKAFTGIERNVGEWSSDFTDPNTAAFVLVYLGQNKDATTAANVTSDMIVQTMSAATAVTTSGSVSKMGKANQTSNYTAADVVGATYQVFFSYNGVLKDLYTDSAMTTKAGVTATVVQDSTTQLFSANPTTLYGAGSSSTTTYVAVPEPAVALLGLLGIGMLIKRRRA